VITIPPEVMISSSRYVSSGKEPADTTRKRLWADLYELRFLTEKRNRTNPSLNAIIVMQSILRKVKGVNRSYTKKPRVFATATGNIVTEFKYKNAIVRWTMDQKGENLEIYTKRNRMEAITGYYEYPFENVLYDFGLSLFEVLDAEKR